ncbi:MAG: stage II sporulation protein M [Candidatus Dormibacteria bacterium]
MSLETFTATRRARWAELESRTAALTGSRLRGLRAADVERFAILYRRAASDLAIARRDYPDQPIAEYLNSLCGRAHVLLNRGSPPRWRHGLSFFATGAPRAFRANAGYFLASLGCLLSGTAAGWLAYALRPDLRGLLVPDSLFAEMAQGSPGIGVPQPFLAAPSIFLHNIEVAVVVFALGLCLGLPTVLLVFLQGWSLGTLGAAVHTGGYDYAFWSLIAAHGMLELSVIVTAGAAGLRLGDALLRPGLRSRGDALARAGREVVGLAVATMLLLVVAGTLEAFVSPSALPGGAKIAIGLGVGACFYAWLLLAGRGRPGVPVLVLDAAPGAGRGGETPLTSRA